MSGRAAVMFVFRLYLAAADTDVSEGAVARFRSLCQAQIAGRFEIEVIDVSERPDLAEQEQILVVPTVVRVAPFPERRVIGDLSDDVRTAAALGLPSPGELSDEGGWP